MIRYPGGNFVSCYDWNQGQNPDYGVLGIYVEAEKDGESYEFYTMGLPQNIQNYVKESLEYINLKEEKYSFLSPFFIK